MTETAGQRQNFLIANGLNKSFGDMAAVDGVSFSIGEGEIFGLLGPNGAGKTTTIRMLSTVLRADGGDVTIGGVSVSADADEVRKIIGVCPQELALYPELSANDNLIFFGRMAGLGGREAKETARENLETVGLADRAKDKVDYFSGGMKRRVNIAIALMNRPKMLFLDEPTVNMDEERRMGFAQRLRAIKGFEQLFVISHDDSFEESIDHLIRIRKNAEGSYLEVR